MGPAGSTITTTAQDLARFGKSHLVNGSPDKQLSIESIREMQRVQPVRFPTTTARGLGWEILEWDAAGTR
jgi:hypothetical protein